MKVVYEIAFVLQHDGLERNAHDQSSHGFALGQRAIAPLEGDIECARRCTANPAQAVGLRGVNLDRAISQKEEIPRTRRRVAEVGDFGMDFEGFAAHQCFDAHRRFALLPESPIATLFTAEICVIARTRAAPTTPQPSNWLRGDQVLQKTIGVAAPNNVGGAVMSVVEAGVGPSYTILCLRRCLRGPVWGKRGIGCDDLARIVRLRADCGTYKNGVGAANLGCSVRPGGPSGGAGAVFRTGGSRATIEETTGSSGRSSMSQPDTRAVSPAVE